MARIDIKTASKLLKALELKALAFAEADAKANRKGSAASKSLAVATRNDASAAMLEAAIDLVGGLATASDGKDWGGSMESTRSWLTFLRKNDSAFASAFKLLKSKPYAQVFKAAGAKE